jgi:hypothetical protein
METRKPARVGSPAVPQEPLLEMREDEIELFPLPSWFKNFVFRLLGGSHKRSSPQAL